MIAIHSKGAFCKVMPANYTMRQKVKAFYQEELKY